MRKLLIVDDEKVIRAGIKIIIERANTSFTKVYEAKNGEEGLDLVKEKDIDLVITDIKMPKMDGITFIKELNKNGKNIRVIILSGYDEFAYAQEALKYGATAYLLKPVDKYELLDFIKQVEGDLDKEAHLVAKEDHINKYIEQFSNNELNYIFLNDYITNEEIDKIIDTIQLDVLHDPYYVAFISLKTNKANDPWEENFKKQVNQYLSSLNIKMVCFWDAKGQFIMIVSQRLELKEFVAFLNTNNFHNLVIGISQISSRGADIKELYHQACEANKYKIIVPKESLIITYEEINSRSSNNDLPINSIIKTQQMMGAKTNFEIDIQLKNIFNLELINRSKIHYLEEVVQNINRYIVQHYHNIIPQFTEPLSQKFRHITDVYRYQHISNYIKDIRAYIFAINDYLWQMNNELITSNGIDMAIKYIKDHYDKDLNMAMVANHVSLNYSYFSQLFKERTNMNFVDYLKEVRVKKSMELLRDPNYKIYEVAEKVGYQNSKHFTKIFRSVTGISPSEYRNKLAL